MCAMIEKLRVSSVDMGSGKIGGAGERKQEIAHKALKIRRGDRGGTTCEVLHRQQIVKALSSSDHWRKMGA